MTSNSKIKNRKRKLDDNDTDHHLPTSKRAKIDSKPCKKKGDSTSSSSSSSIDAKKQELLDKYHTVFPWTFFKFWQWMQSITDDDENPCNALRDTLRLRLVGPFEYLNGDLSQLSDEQILIHHRYYFDLPEFQTIAIQVDDHHDDDHDNAAHVHYGYWRDDPKQNPVGIVKANGDDTVTDKVVQMVHPIASNMFVFVLDLLQLATGNIKQQKLHESLLTFIASHHIRLDDAKNKLQSFKQRERKIVARTFHGLGLVVPFKNEIGYREPGYTVQEFKRIFKRMHGEKLKGKKVKAEEMQFVMGNIPLADDEGDPGMGYEVGIAFFYSYPMFQEKAKRLLSNAYRLTNRHGFEAVLKAHCKVRGKDMREYDQLKMVKSKKRKKTLHDYM